MSKRSKSAGNTIEQKRQRIQVDNNANEEKSSGSHALGEARCGRVLALRLKNFMCHKNLAVDFNPRTNLLIGANGSGKSAVLTALIIGLGAKATATNRSNSIKELVRIGQPRSSIEIDLSNEGDDAYQPDIYGNRITVVRQISSAGASSYKIVAANGNVVSKSHSALHDIVYAMNIQVDNPVCVLTQDASRGFLRDSDPKKRYQLFLKATQIDKIIDTLTSNAETYEAAKQRLNDFEKEINVIQTKHLKLESQVKAIKSLQPMKIEIKRCEIEKKWIAVQTREKFIEELKITLRDAEDQRDKFKNNSNNREEKNKKYESQINELNKIIEELNNSISSEKSKLEELKSEFNANQEQIDIKNNELSRIRTKKCRVESNISKLEEELKSDANEQENARRLENETKLEEMRQKIKEIEIIITGSKRDLELMRNTENDYKEKIQRLEYEINQNNRHINHLTVRLKNVNESEKDNAKMFGEDIPKLLNDIENLHRNKKFQTMPLGPVGNHIEIVEPKYRVVVENLLSTVLNAFIVDNNQDMETLRNLNRQKYQNLRFPIIKSKFLNKVYNTNGKSVHSSSKAPILMDVIKVKNPNIMNCLLDQSAIETILLVDNYEYAIHLTSKKENVPANLSKVVLLDPCSEFYPAPKYRSYSKKLKPAKYLRVDVSQRESVYRADLEATENKKLKLTDELKILREKFHVIENSKAEKQRNISKLTPEESSLKFSIHELECIEYNSNSELGYLKNELRNHKAELEKLLDNKKELEDDYDCLVQNSEATRRKMRLIEEKVQELERGIDTNRKKIEETEAEERKMASNYEFEKNKIVKIESIAIPKLNAEIKQEMKLLERVTSQAMAVGPRIESTSTAEEIVTKIKKIERIIQKSVNLDASPEQVLESFEKIQKEYSEKSVIYENLKSTKEKMNELTRDCYRHAQRLMNYMIIRIKYQFSRILTLRGFSGELSFDITKKMLDMEVSSRDKEGSQNGCRTTNLSGGERSYVTVALLMSLWSCVDHPFYFLDEYDVFTDNVNRSFITKLLLNEAGKNPHLQYTFLTPQDISDVQSSETLSVLRLANPER